MISYKRALKLMKQNIKVSDKSEIVNIKNSYKRIVSKNIFSYIDNPKINASAMDGIVIFKTDLKKNKFLKVVGESKAGDEFTKDFKKGEAKFIYTGAPVPGSNKTVIPKENYVFYEKKNS